LVRPSAPAASAPRADCAQEGVHHAFREIDLRVAVEVFAELVKAHAERGRRIVGEIVRAGFRARGDGDPDFADVNLLAPHWLAGVGDAEVEGGVVVKEHGVGRHAHAARAIAEEGAFEADLGEKLPKIAIDFVLRQGPVVEQLVDRFRFAVRGRDVREDLGVGRRDVEIGGDLALFAGEHVEPSRTARKTT